MCFEGKEPLLLDPHEAPENKLKTVEGVRFGYEAENNLKIIFLNQKPYNNASGLFSSHSP